MISVDSPERALDALPTVEGDALRVSREACASLEDQAPTGKPPLEDKAANEALHVEEVGSPPPRVRQPSLELYEARRTRSSDKLILCSYV